MYKRTFMWGAHRPRACVNVSALNVERPGIEPPTFRLVGDLRPPDPQNKMQIA